MFTRLSNFSYGNYQIANISSTEMNVDTQLLIQIQKYETECLRLLLGENLYTDLMSNLELDGLYWKVKSGSDAKWSSLLNGVSYPDPCDNTKNITWRGILNKVATVQGTEVIECLTAPYVFFYYSLNTRTSNVGVGEVRLKADNTTQESSKNKRVDAWNEFVQWSSYGFSDSNVSLFQFLNDNFQEYNNGCSFLNLQTMTYYDI